MVQCKAKSKRSGEQCKNYAIRGMKVCRFHGGIQGGKKAKRARKTAPLKHGFYTASAKADRKKTRELIKNIRTSLG